MKNQTIKTARRRLFFDIETSPNLVFAWKAGHEENINYQDIIQERAIICICWKWEHEKQVRHLTWDKDQDDETLVKRFAEVVKDADEVVTHNGDFFDIRWFRTRCIKHGVSLPPNLTSIDTCKSARSKFLFNSNSLNYLGQFLGLGKKLDNGGIDLWKDIVLRKSKPALKKMVDYCKQDVILLERLFNKMNAYIPPKSSFARFVSSCPECSSPNTVVNRHRKTAAGYQQTTFQCKDCGKYHTVATSKFNKERG